MGIVINGKKLQERVTEEFSKDLKKISDKLKLVVIQVGNDSSSDVYVKNKKNLCEKVGILFEHLKYDDSVLEEDLIKVINKLNTDDSVTGILVQLPLPDSIDSDKVINSISSFKDVDGLTDSNVGKLFSLKDGLVPCTALGVMRILDSINYPLKGARVVVVGRSKLVGLPLVSLLLKENATVTVCHSKTSNLADVTKDADVLIVAAGVKNLISSDYVKEGAVVIDVGINKVNGKLYGDCNFDNIIDKVGYITPVPGGVGPLTVTYLVGNVIKAYYLQKKD